MTIIAFKKPEQPEPRVWVCNCGCGGFWLYEDGRIQCMDCDEFHDSMKGEWSVVEAAEPA